MSFVYAKIGSRITARANMRQSQVCEVRENERQNCQHFQTAPPPQQVTIVRSKTNYSNVDVPHRRFELPITKRTLN